METLPTLLQTPHLTSAVELSQVQKQKSKLIHKHESAEILFIQEGKANYVLNGETFTVKRGDLLLINSNIEHEAVSCVDSSLKGYSLTFSGLHLSLLPEGFITPLNEMPILNVQDQHITIQKYIEDIHEEFKNNDPGSQDIISSLLKTLIIKILRILCCKNSGQNASISDKVKKYISENYNRDISLNELANIVFVNPYHLAHTFKDETGSSPIQYLITYRIEVAKTLLLSTNSPISEIASIVGYPNANYFNLLFKKYTGYSPGKFRKKTS
jgi:AraC-like DNA-binding protein